MICKQFNNNMNEALFKHEMQRARAKTLRAPQT